ncbi:MAG: hypothetical protein VX278_12085 [Myxococcota bacterium]|nr:hypothetical protein [Myxococcota bacterium]
MPKKALVICPGRGSYSKDTLGYLKDSSSQKLAEANRFRKLRHQPTPSELDSKPRFAARFHLAGESASILTAACSLADYDSINLDKYDIIGVCGNSMGHYTALAISGVLSLQDSLRLIDQMGAYQEDNIIGGQLLYPLADEDWIVQNNRILQINTLVEQIPDLYHSIHLGTQAILGGTKEALQRANEQLPPCKQSRHTFPILLPMHSAFHTPLMEFTARRAQWDLSDLQWESPRITLIGGLGNVWHPKACNPQKIKEYTLGPQLLEPYDFNQMLQNAIAHLSPEVLILLGPGSNLGGAVAQNLISLGWSEIRSKKDFLTRQTEAPILLSMGRPLQRDLVCN